MSWWGDKKTATNLEICPEPVVDRVAEAQARVTELKSELSLLDAEMLAFKTKNRVTTDWFGRLLGVQCAAMNGRAAIEKQWRALLKRRDGLVSAWHKALFKWSEVKGQSK
jgi:hypothetical protein